MKKTILSISVVLMLAMFAFFFMGCDGSIDNGGNGNGGSNNGGSANGNGDTNPPIVQVNTTIVLSGNTVEINGDGAVFENRRLTITRPGVYNISGTLDNGQIIVDVAREHRVELIMTNVTITCLDSAVIHAKDTDRLIITIPEGTTTTFTDATHYTFPQGGDRPHSAIYSRRSVTIRGGGTLYVNANFRNGIWSRGSVRIQHSTVNVTAPHNGIRGRNSVRITDSTFNITAGNDAIRVTRENDPERGFVRIENSAGRISAGDDGIQATTDVNISGSSVYVAARGWFVVAPGQENIQEGNLILN
ncbi:MAG: carbohydrate-binding domain-containing protein [Oscillospiraceae bacterium]|nr:carbohydrate-binding domain-containing protein [Oscillospiraceae bacterium]